jgi:hypothetical protein
MGTSQPRLIRSLLLVLFLLSGFIAILEAQSTAVFPNKNACPVIADLFPKQERAGDYLKFIFPDNAIITVDEAGDLSRVAQRMSIALLTAGHEDVEIRFYWKSAVVIDPEINWGESSGVLMVKGDGKPNCFSLGYSAGLPVNIPCSEFLFMIPPGVEIKEVLFSSLACEEPKTGDCPMPELERQIGEAFLDSLRTPQDEMKTKRFISLMEKTIPEFGCFTREEGRPVPALFLADLASIWNWLDYLYQKMDEADDYALQVYAGINNLDPDGVLGEVMADHIWKILQNRPLFILKNWPDIRSYKRNILAGRGLETPTDTLGIINIYSDIARKEPKYKSACDEIIGILSKKEPSERCGRP